MSEYQTGYDYEPPQSGGDFLSLRKKGESIRIRLASEPVIFQENIKTSDGPKDVMRAAWIVIHKEAVGGEKKITAKHFKGGMYIFGEIKKHALDPDWGDPTTYDFKITRTEEDGKYYQVVPDPNKKPIPPEQQALLDEKGFDLRAIYIDKTAHRTPNPVKDEDIDPFDDAD